MRGLNAVEGSQPGEDLASPKTPMGEIDRPASAQSEREDIPSAALSEEPEAGLELPIRPNAGASGPITPGPAQEERAGSPPKTAEFLLVDDNPVNMRMISHHMKKLGHAFETAADGKQAYDVVREGAGRFKCIFMDISMPVMDGFESTRLIRAFEREQQLPRSHVFALTGLASESAQQEAFACGIDLFLTKPVKLKELNRILEERNLGTSRV
jgi:CheY-like chemotaxis protein